MRLTRDTLLALERDCIAPEASPTDRRANERERIFIANDGFPHLRREQAELRHVEDDLVVCESLQDTIKIASRSLQPVRLLAIDTLAINDVVAFLMPREKFGDKRRGILAINIDEYKQVANGIAKTGVK